MPEYVFDNAAAEASARFGGLEELYDPLTIRHLAACGVADGWTCLEVGGGAGSIGLWLSEHVAPHGRVVMTDIDTRHVASLASPMLEVRRHDIVSDPIEPETYDLAHTRLVLVHLPERVRAIENMICALKPGGWLVLQEFDAPCIKPEPELASGEYLLKTLLALWDVMAARGVDNRFGRRLAPTLTALSMRDVTAEGFVVLNRGGSPGARILRANFEQLREPILASGGVTEAEFEQDLARLDDPSVTWPSQVMWTVRARKP